ncbi:MAG: UDP-N-acetylmuramate dehydrogenase [Actinomycetota bacterium]|nr:UDP-N-acetylmuramate dehydrogenase [Actinomycetota bacterium]
MDAAPDVVEDAPLSGLTTLRVGGPAARLIRVTTADDLVDAVHEVDDADEPLLVIAGGSNLLVTDEGFDGTVVQIATSGVEVASSDLCSGMSLQVAAGEPWDDVVRRAVDEGWVGVEALSGIPGSTGATPVQNVGAYGQEVAQTISSVRTWDRQHDRVRTFAVGECGFTYRSSLFKTDSRYVVLDVTFQLPFGDLSGPIGYADLARALGVSLGARVPLADAREAVLAQRRLRGMVLDAADHDTWSAGSFFTNPILSTGGFARLAARAGLAGAGEPPSYPADGGVKTSAAWLIERAGFGKGFGLPGPAALSTKHTLALTNRGGASAADLVVLARRVRDGVQDRFGIRLDPEPRLIGLTL